VLYCAQHLEKGRVCALQYSKHNIYGYGESIDRRDTTVKERANELRNPIDAFFYIINVEALRSDDIVEAIKK